MTLELINGKLTKAGADYTLDATNADLEYIGLYFSAHWCPPCRGFTPVLTTYYNKVNADKLRFEVVFVSSDQDESQFKNYFDTMPWSALKFEERDVKGQLAQKYGIRGIPTLVILNTNGEIKNENGRGVVQQQAENDTPELQF